MSRKSTWGPSTASSALPIADFHVGTGEDHKKTILLVCINENFVPFLNQL